MPHAEVEDPSPWEASPVAIDVPGGLQHFGIASESSATINRVASTASSLEEESQKDGKGRALVDLVVEGQVLTRWLTAVQCTLAPVFCVTALLADDLRWWYPVTALGFGLVLASATFYAFEDHHHPGRVMLCFVGFFVSMVWILTIVNEVVGVLQTFGHVFGLSDAILGLTIFAMGNSLGDLVANATVARMGFPSMAIAACFGGPMLNILLGVGLSGSYVIATNGGAPFHVDMSRTLVVSGVGLLAVLLATLVLVPLNGYWMNKKLGVGLILSYVVVLTLNVATEVWL